MSRPCQFASFGIALPTRQQAWPRVVEACDARLVALWVAAHDKTNGISHHPIGPAWPESPIKFSILLTATSQTIS